MPGHVVPGRPVLAGTFLLFSSAQGFLLGSAGVQDVYPGAVFSVSAGHSLGIHVIVLNMQNAGLSLCSVPCVPLSHFHLVAYTLKLFFFLFLFPLT